MEAPRERKPIEPWRYVLWIAVAGIAIYMIVSALVQMAHGS